MSNRLSIQKTYKLYIGGKFPRTESGRYTKLSSAKGEYIANMCIASRKDFRDAVRAARSAFSGWQDKTAYNRGQILYRIAEMMEGRTTQFSQELTLQGLTRNQADREVEASIDRMVYYAGWADKFQQLASTVNPVSSSHFNFSVPEPMGVVVIIAPETPSLLGLTSQMAPVILSGNTVVVLASESMPLCAITFGEVIHSSDVPGGVVNILTGTKSELLPHMSSHMDVNAISYCGNNEDERKLVGESAAENVKRVKYYSQPYRNDRGNESLYHILDFVEIKTTWHPVGI